MNRRGTISGLYLAFFYARRLLACRRRKDRWVALSESRTPVSTAATGRSRTPWGVGIAREPQGAPEQYARRAAHGPDGPGMERLGEIYLYARFRDAVPAALAQGFDVLEPRVLAAIERLEATQTVKA